MGRYFASTNRRLCSLKKTDLGKLPYQVLVFEYQPARQSRYYDEYALQDVASCWFQTEREALEVMQCFALVWREFPTLEQAEQYIYDSTVTDKEDPGACWNRAHRCGALSC